MNDAMKFVRCHVVEAKPMTRGDYNKLRGWVVPANENPADEGYYIVYPDGYQSWCPKAQFEAAGVKADDGLPYGYAMILCQFFGKKIQRANWNGQGQYVEFRHVATLMEDEADAIIDEGNERDCFAFVFNFVNRKTGETGIQVGWLASQADMYASDWRIIG